MLLAPLWMMSGHGLWSSIGQGLFPTRGMEKNTYFREKVGGSTHTGVSCSGAPLLIFFFEATEWTLLALFIRIGIGLDLNLLNLGCSCT